MNKEIEEMARTIIQPCKISCKECDKKCRDYNLSRSLYNAGYRKAEEVRKETAKEILQQVYDFLNDKNDKFDVFELAKEYGVEVEE